MSSKTKKNRKTKSKNTTRKNFAKGTFNEARFAIDGVEAKGTNGKFVRIQMLKIPKNPENPEIRRKLTRGIDYWKKDDIIKFNYLSKKYGFPGKKTKGKTKGYILSPEDKKNINILLKSKGIREDEDTPTPEE